MTTYIKGTKLEWPDLWNALGMERDKGERWYPSESTPQSVQDYLSGYRAPSRAYPRSYATPLLTAKFAKYLTEHEPALAIKLGVAA